MILQVGESEEKDNSFNTTNIIMLQARSLLSFEKYDVGERYIEIEVRKMGRNGS